MRYAETSSRPFHDAVRIWIRHKKKAFAVFCAILAIVFVAILLWPRSYRSEAMLFVRVGRETVALDPTATMGQTVDVLTPREAEINSVAEILASRAMAEKVVEIVGVDDILQSDDWTDSLFTTLGQFVSDRTSDDAVRRDAAVRHLMNNLDVWATKKSTVISVRATAHTPKLAQRFVAGLMDVYQSEHLRLNRTPGSHAFFQEQTELLENQLAETNANLRDLKNEKAFGSLEGELELLETQKADVEKELLAREHQIAHSKAVTQELTKMIANLDEMIVTKRLTGGFHNASDGMRQQLYNLEIQERELSKTYEDGYPRMKTIRKQLEDVRQIYGREDHRNASTEEVNPNRLELQLKLLDQHATEAGLQAANQRLTQQHQEVLRKLRDLNNYQVQVKNLQRQADLLETSCQTYAENLEQARIDSAIEGERISNVNVVQEATWEPKPVSPQKLLIAGLGLIVALSGSLSVALIADGNDDRLTSTAEVESELGLPVWLANPQAEEQCAHV